MSEVITFARRFLLKAKPAKVNEFLSTMKEKIYTELSKENGIRRIYLLKDTGQQNEFISLTLWNSKSDADTYESTGHFSANKENVTELLEEDPRVSQFEVEYHTVSPTLPAPAASKKRARVSRARKGSAKRR
jgi:quinol monooxygenase YgiN